MTLEDYLKDKGKYNEVRKNSYRESLIKRTLLTVTLCLIVLIISNVSDKFSSLVKKEVFETDFNFSKINTLYKKYFLNIKDKIIKKEETEAVSKVVEDTYKKEDYKDGVLLSVSSNYTVKALDSGLIVFIGEKEGLGNVVVMQQSNGIDVTYGYVNSLDIKVYDYIEKGTIIGSAEGKLYLKFEKDGEVLDYNTYIQ